MDTGRDRGLERIVAMLVALAVLAERAAVRSFPVRWVVLCLLRRAEPVVRSCVAEVTQCEWPCPHDVSDTRYRPADAELLAAFFRAMAAALAALLPPAHCLPGRSRLVDGTRGGIAPRCGWLAVAPWRRPVEPNDTS